MANVLEVDLIANDGRGLDSVDRFERAIVGAERRLVGLGRLGSEAGNAIGSGLGIPLGPAAALTAATVGLVAGMKSAIDAARAAADANRVLSASATEAGINYAVATEKAQKFATQTGQSTTEAQKTFSSLLQVARASGHTKDIDQMQKNFSDLAAARGIAASELGTLMQQILSGQDEALNQMGVADPSMLAKQWADANHRTVESMTQMEQVWSRVDAVMRKGAIFDGAAVERLASVSGQIEVANASLTNMTTNIGNAIFANREFRDALKSVNEILIAVSGSADDVQAKLARGLTPAQIAGQQTASSAAQFFDLAKTGQWQTMLVHQFATMASGSPDALLGPAGLFLAIQKKRFEDSMKEVEAEQRLLEKQKRSALDMAQLEADKLAEAEQRIASAAAAKAAKLASTEQLADIMQRAGDLVGREPDLNARIASIQRLRTEVENLGKTGDLAVTGTKEKLASLDDQIFKTQQQVHDLVQETFTDTRTFLNDMAQRVNKDNPFVTLIEQADSVMGRMQKRFGAFGSEFVSQMAAVENKALDLERISARIQSAQKVLDIQAEIRKLAFGPIGTSAEDQRRLTVYDKRLAAARDIPRLEAQARAVEQAGFGRGPAALDQGAILNRQIQEILKLRTQFFGETGFGTREAQSKINEQLISLFESASPEMQARLIQGGKRDEIAQAYKGQAADRRQAIQDEIERAAFARLDIEAAQKKLVDLRRFGGFDSDEVRKQFLAITGGLSPAEMTGELRRGRTQALLVESTKEAEKERKAEEDRKLLNAALNIITQQITGKGFKVDQASAALLIEVKDLSNKAQVTGPGFSPDPEDLRKQMQF